eukprot:gene20253-20825_t
MKNTLIVTGCDEAHFDLADDMLTSFRINYKDMYKIAFVCFGPKRAPDGIVAKADLYLQHDEGYAAFDRRIGYYAAFAAIKPRIQDLFPGYAAYCWIDADCWFASADSVQRIFFGAAQSDISIHPECDIHYMHFPTPHARCAQIYRKNEARHFDKMPLNLPMLNAGVFAMRASSPLWKAWKNELKSLADRHRAGEDVYFSDQIPLHKLIHTTQVEVFHLRATENWLANICPPIIHRATKSIRAPTPPYEPVGLVHFAGPKQNILGNDGTGSTISLRYGDVQKYFAQG